MNKQKNERLPFKTVMAYSRRGFAIWWKAEPEILIAAAVQDPIAESDLYQKYNDLTGNCTSVYISPRLASARFCDRVLLIVNGGIAAGGNPDGVPAAGSGGW